MWMLWINRRRRKNGSILSSSKYYAPFPKQEIIYETIEAFWDQVSRPKRVLQPMAVLDPDRMGISLRKDYV